MVGGKAELICNAWTEWDQDQDGESLMSSCWQGVLCLRENDQPPE